MTTPKFAGDLAPRARRENARSPANSAAWIDRAKSAGRFKLERASAESLNVDPGRGAVLIPAERPPALGTTPLLANKHWSRCRRSESIDSQCSNHRGKPMKKSLAVLALSAFALTHGAVLAQEKKSAPAQEEVKKTEAAKKAEPKKEEGKKKIKKGGC